MSSTIIAAAITTRRWLWIGVTCGMAAGVAVGSWNGLGRGALLAAPVFGFSVLIAVIIGEVRVVRPAGVVRRASLTPRTLRSYLPRWLTGAVGGTVIALSALSVVTTLTAAPDDMGRQGRSLVRQCDATMTTAVGPWPGAFYTLPLALALGLGLIIATTAYYRIVRRARVGAGKTEDDELRGRSARVITAATGILVAVPACGYFLTTAGALLEVTCRPAWWSVAGWSLLASVPAELYLIAMCGASLWQRPTPSNVLNESPSSP